MRDWRAWDLPGSQLCTVYAVERLSFLGYLVGILAWKIVVGLLSGLEGMAWGFGDWELRAFANWVVSLRLVTHKNGRRILVISTSPMAYPDRNSILIPCYRFSFSRHYRNAGRRDSVLKCSGAVDLHAGLGAVWFSTAGLTDYAGDTSQRRLALHLP